MNDAVYKFKRYEDASLSYTGIDCHEGEDCGGWDTVLSDASNSYTPRPVGSSVGIGAAKPSFGLNS